MNARLMIRLILAIVLAAPLAACLQPANGLRLDGLSTSSRLSEVSVSRVDGYLGYQLKSELDYLLSNGASGRANVYALQLKVSEEPGLSVIDLPSGRPQVVALQIQATYELRHVKTGKIVGSGRTFASGSYDRSQQRFATIRAERDAEERVAKSLAERLRIIVVTLLNREPNAGGGAAPDLLPKIDSQFDEPVQDPGDAT